jgi:RNA-binding protein YlmH
VREVKREFYSGDSDEDRLLISRVNDAIDAVSCNYAAKFIGFLDMHKRNVAEGVLKAAQADCKSVFWGGFDAAERVYLGLFEPGEQPETDMFPIGALKFAWKFGEPTHRDFLGALMSLGVKREKLGDIALGAGECTVVLDAAIMGFVSQNLAKVGGCGVTCIPAELSRIKKSQDFSNISDTIASPRLDCIVAALVNMSRAQCERLIESGCVSIDFETATNAAVKVSGGATVSIRGHGRFIVDSIGPATKKGRLRFTARTYL